MFNIFKSFNIAYGHSVWKQTLRSKLAGNCKLACRHLHGHNADVVIHMEAESLDHKGMVLDFKEMSFIKKFLDDVVDHKMILDIGDPALKLFLQSLDITNDDSYAHHLVYNDDGQYYTVKKSFYSDLSLREQEIYAGMIIVNFIPTAENLALWIYEYCQSKVEGIATVSKVQIFETPKACAEYIPTKKNK
jgi:6-pyruvoyltetrahydropterin/6-carboxytetrahydropterin synthase